MKTINFELSKRLNERWLLNNIDTEYLIYKNKKWIVSIEENKKLTTWTSFNEIQKECIALKEEIYKTLTLEEAIEFMPIYIKWKYKFNYEKFNKVVPYSNMRKWDKHWIKYTYNWEWYIQYWKTLLEAIEEMLEWLLNNKLLWKI